MHGFSHSKESIAGIAPNFIFNPCLLESIEFSIVATVCVYIYKVEDQVVMVMIWIPVHYMVVKQRAINKLICSE